MARFLRGDDTFDLARIEAGRVLVSPEPVELEAVLSEVKDTLQQLAARESIRVRVDSVPLEARWVIADRTRLKQILMNYGARSKAARPRGAGGPPPSDHGMIRLVPWVMRST